MNDAAIAMAVQESAFAFRCQDDLLVGILTAPAQGQPVHKVGLVVVVGGPQYRAGSHRQFVQLARHLASHGVVVLRFDYRGMGDSEGVERDFLSIDADVAAAVDAMLGTQSDLTHVALWGLCDGASASLLYCDGMPDPRIAGLCLLNPWVRSDSSQAKAQIKHYYKDRLMQREFWIKLLSGKVASAALTGVLRNMRLALGRQAAPADEATRSFQQRMADGRRKFGGRILILLSGNDYTAREFEEFAAADPAWQGLLAEPEVLVEHLPGADHTFSDPAGRQRVEELTARWVLDLRPAG